MRKLVVVVMGFLMVLLSCKNNEKNTVTENFNSDRTKFSKTLANKILVAQKEGSFYKLSSTEAMPVMVKSLNEGVQKQSYAKIKALFGDYKGLEFHSIKEITKGETYKIYRFKGDFELNSDTEIRVVLNKDGKLAGFFVKPWDNKL